MAKRVVTWLVAGLGAVLIGGCMSLPSGGVVDEEARAEQESHLLILSNHVAVVGVLPRVGGRTVVYRLQDGANVLLSDPAQWSLPAEQYPVPAADAEWQAFNGHSVWVGPQKDWWTDQELNEERKAHAAVWPPDPWLIFAEFRVTEQADNYLKLEGPESPVSGLQLTKEVSLLPDGRVRHRVTARNVRDRAVRWDLWTNTRLPGGSRCYVPTVDGKVHVRTEFSTDAPARVAPLPIRSVDGFLTFDLSSPVGAGVERRIGKAFVSPIDCAMAGFNGNRVLIKRISRVDRRFVHPSHAIVELYQDQELTELAAHGPWVTLAPGEMMSFTEQWGVYHYDGSGEPESQVAFLRSLRVFEYQPPAE